MWGLRQPLTGFSLANAPVGSTTGCGGGLYRASAASASPNRGCWDVPSSRNIAVGK